MAHRRLNDKKANRLRGALTNTPPLYIDLVEYLVDNHRVGFRRLTKTKARQLLLDGKVKVGSHTVGRIEVEVAGKKKWVLNPYLPSHQRSEIMVVA
jgi:hypothetical protein